MDKVHQYEERLDIEGLIERALANIKVEEIVPESAQEQEDEFAELL